MKITVLVSSPADQQKEAEAAIEAIEHLHDLLKPYGHSIEHMNWKRNIATGRAERGQEVVNEQIKRADVIIAIFGLRIGTDTGLYESGTIEEIEEFFARSVDGQPSYDVHIFFNNKAAEEPLSIDAEQLQKVQRFRESLNSRGVNFGQFSNLDTLKNMVRLGLNEYAARNKPQSQLTENDPLGEFEELGSLDASDLAESYMDKAVSEMSLIAKSFVEMTTKLAEVNASAPVDKDDRSASRQFFSSAAAVLNNSRTQIQGLALSLRENLSLSFAYTNMALTIELEDNLLSNHSTDTTALAEAISASIQSSNAAKQSLSGTMEALSRIPRRTSELKTAKRQLLEVYDHIITTFSDFIRDQNTILALLPNPSESSSGSTQLISPNA